MCDERTPYDLDDARMSDACLARILRAVVATGAKITDSFVWDGAGKYPPVSFRVWVHPSRKKTFEDVAEVTLSDPPRVEGM